MMSAAVRLFLLPGDLVCDAMRLASPSEHRQVLRSFVNTMVWSAVGIGVVLATSL